ncbi:MAG TPA: hypothetical protein VLB11_06045 [Methyloceanibacter sp.]|nr:hypothetical protein [Methyloceanibacter sp.]
MPVYLVLVACLAAPPNTCKEIPLPEVTSEDVVHCVSTAAEKSEEWQSKNKDYLVIATKCAKSPEGSLTPPAEQSN